MDWDWGLNIDLANDPLVEMFHTNVPTTPPNGGPPNNGPNDGIEEDGVLTLPPVPVYPDQLPDWNCTDNGANDWNWCGNGAGDILMLPPLDPLGPPPAEEPPGSDLDVPPLDNA